MKTLYCTRITLRTIRPSDMEPQFVADVAFATEKMPHEATTPVLDSLVYLDVHKGSSDFMTVIGDTFPLAGLPDGFSIDTPQWSNGEVDVWVIQRAGQPQ